MISPASTEKRVEVVAAVIEDRCDGLLTRYLLAERPIGKIWAGYWEFPGGKIEPGETPRQALDRELHEELGIQVREAFPWITREFHYPHARVKLYFFRVTAWEGMPHGKEGQVLAWQSPDSPQAFPILPANYPVLRALSLPTFYGISHATEMGSAVFLARMQAALERGLRLIQIREKAWSEAVLLNFTKQAVALAHAYSAKIIINEDVAIVRATGADGLHLTSKQLAELTVRPDVPWCGASCHTRQEITRAAELDLDFVVLGPVKPTLTHPGVSTLGWEEFARLASDSPIPVYALGGLQHEDCEQAWLNHAHGVAMLRQAW